MKVLLADDHRLVRAGLRALLDSIASVEVVAEASDGEEAMRLMHELRPDVAMVDIAMPRLSGLAVLHQVCAAGLPTRVLLLSMYDNDEYVAEAVRAGAAGYLIKDSAVEELGLALQALERGDVYLSPAISRKLAAAFSAGRASPGLTARQTQVLRLIALGMSSKEVARELDLSVKTVETHRTQIMDRLQIRDLAGLVRYAVRTGLVGTDP
ncbi:MAG TPA: response regulator transcription factor [Ramlibacter sp.]|uniref:response regulator transcription factor n=1 Tax=Ramlibacter sp. TaxID=1917967 RepID=UPI002BE57D67|nr:response regulator transcription factor [Ramlibacter sp.]HVZ46051.1 response regulator transcription factor [Ramlibacter sp.]